MIHELGVHLLWGQKVLIFSVLTEIKKYRRIKRGKKYYKLG